MGTRRHSPADSPCRAVPSFASHPASFLSGCSVFCLTPCFVLVRLFRLLLHPLLHSCQAVPSFASAPASFLSGCSVYCFTPCFVLVRLFRLLLHPLLRSCPSVAGTVITLFSYSSGPWTLFNEPGHVTPSFR